MIGKIVLTMLVAAAKINQSSIVPAFELFLKFVRVTEVRICNK